MTLSQSKPPFPGDHQTSPNGREDVCSATTSPILSSGTVTIAIEIVGDPYLTGPQRGEKENAFIGEQSVQQEKGKDAHVDQRPVVNAFIMGQNVRLERAKNARVDQCPSTQE